MKVHYLVYKLTNLVNGKIYIGCHMTKDVNDDYMGSGRRLSYAKKKYGIENFKKEILSAHETPEEMLAEEARLVNEEFLGRDDVYNLTVGGKGSWFYTNLTLTPEQRTKAGKAGGYANFSFEQRSKFSKESGVGGQVLRNLWELHRDSFELNRKAAITKAASKESNDKRKETFSKIDHQKGVKNSQYGTCWIYSKTLKKSIKIDHKEIDDYIDQGWVLGRKLKFE